MVWAVFLDLTVWHHWLNCKLLYVLPNRHMVHMIMELVRNRSFTLTTGLGKQRRLRYLRNNVPQRSVLAPLLYNIYTLDLAIVCSAEKKILLEETLSQYVTTFLGYLQN